MSKLSLLLVALVCATAHAEWSSEMENHNLFQGDMVLDPDEIEKGWNEDRVTGQAFASIKGGRWPKNIPYVIESSIGSSGRSAIASAIENYHKYTCLRFHKRQRESSYISFYKGRGCSSPVGYRRGRVNRISLAGGCWRTGIVMHEIGHSIGLYHEQSRPDRDQHVKILTHNIQSGMAYNFNKFSTSTINSLGTPYDYKSMMHYGAYAFGGRRMTIQTKDPAMQRVIGQRGGFSEIDKKQIALMYNCAGGGGGGPNPPPQPTNCKDYHSRCAEWAGRSPSECTKNPRYMLRWCKKSCKVQNC